MEKSEVSACTPRQNTTNSVRVLILLVLAFVGAIVTGGAMKALTAMKVDIMWSIVLQDVLLFIVPAILLAVICYKRPWHFLEVDHAPSWLGLAVVVLVWAVSLPALNWITDWNQNMHLPESLATLERALRAMEDSATALTKQLLSMTTVADLLLGVLVVGMMAGLSEELFFRGAMLGIMRRGRANIHVVIWAVAVIFSAIHMQFFGFVPRMLLGAWFGYLLLWTRSLWAPIIAHSLNNSAVVVMDWLADNNLINGDAVDHLGVPADGAFPWLAACSALLTVALIVGARQFFRKKQAKYSACL